MRVLITGAGGPAGVNFTQSLRIAPETMCLVGTEANQYYTHLASTDRVYQVPKATDPAYIDQIDEIIAKEKIEFIHPQPDIEVKAVSENRDKLKAATFLPSKAAITTCQDKFQSAKTWLRYTIWKESLLRLH